RTLALPVVRDDRLRELEKALFNEHNSAVEHDDVQTVKLFVEEIVSRRQDIILAMHGGINRAVISYLTGMGLSDTRHFFMDFASVSLIELVDISGEMKWRVKMLNDTTHLRVP
ncbi:MAG: histidine phosphatase family protein, partial [Patescibacteria group bacterium]